MVKWLYIFVTVCVCAQAQDDYFDPGFHVQAADYWNFRGGIDNQIVTLNHLTNSVYGTSGYWSISPSPLTSMWWSASSPQLSPSPVQIGQAVYFDSPLYVIVSSLTNQGYELAYNLTNPNVNELSATLLAKFGQDRSTSQQYDIFGHVADIGGGGGFHITDTATNPFAAIETSGAQATVKGRPIIGWLTNRWYFVAYYYTNSGVCKIQFWDALTRLQVGLTSHGEVPYSTGHVARVRLGRLDLHGTYPNVNNTFALVCMQTTNVSYPLLPWHFAPDSTAPAVTITNPSPNGTTVIGASQNIQGTASDTNGSGVAAVSVSINGGVYSDAIGTDTWTYSATFNTSASNTVAVRAEDNFGNVSAITTNTYQCNSDYTTQDSLGGAAAGFISLNRFGDIADAVNFTAGSTYTLTKLELYLAKVGSPNYNLTAHIFTDTNEPSVEVGSGSAIVAASSVGGSSSAVAFTNMSCSLTSGTTYWIVLCASSSDNDNYINVDYVSSTNGVHRSSSCGGGSWATVTEFNRSKFITYSGP